MNFLKAGFDEAKWNTFSKNRLSNDIIQLPHRRSVNRIDKLCNSSSVRDVRRLPYRDLTIGILLFSLGVSTSVTYFQYTISERDMLDDK